MSKEILRDKTVGGLEGFLASGWFDGLCWAVIVAAAVYFAPPVVAIICR